MDQKAVELLQQLVNDQRKQTELLQQHLGRFRFSLRLLLILMTLTAIGLGFVGYKQHEQSQMPSPYFIGGGGYNPPPPAGYVNEPVLYDRIKMPTAKPSEE